MLPPAKSLNPNPFKSSASRIINTAEMAVFLEHYKRSTAEPHLLSSDPPTDVLLMQSEHKVSVGR